jgi:hypothetical protein
MELTENILDQTKEAIGLSSESSSSFDTDLLMHINSAIGKLNQNGIGNFIVVDEATTWEDFQNPTQTEGNQYFQMIPSFITLSTKLIFDPPPPSNVQYYKDNIDQLLWRLKLAYEEPYVPPVPTSILE